MASWHDDNTEQDAGHWTVRAALALTVVSIILMLAALAIGASNAGAHLVRYPDHPKKSHLENRLASQELNLRHAEYVCRHGRGATKRWHCWAASSVVRPNGQGWLRREQRKTLAVLVWRLAPIPAIEVVFGEHAGDALEVARCESDYYPTDGVPDTVAHNGQYLGMFQMGSSEREKWGHSSTAYGQARAAHRYFVASGSDWSPWECKP